MPPSERTALVWIPAFAGMTGEIKVVNRHSARLHFDRFARPGTVVGALAIDFQRRIGGRHLFDGAGEMVEHARDRCHRRPAIATLGHLALGVVRGGFLAELDGEGVDLVGVEHAPRQLGRFAQRDREHALGQRVECAAVPDLGLGIAALAQHALDHADRLRRTQPARLVEDQPAMRCGLEVAHPAIPRATHSASSK